MRRRSFLAAIAAAFVAPDPEKLLWQPGKKLISIPAPRRIVLYTKFEDDLPLVASRWHKHFPWRTIAVIDSGKSAALPPSNGGSILVPNRPPALRRFP